MVESNIFSIEDKTFYFGSAIPDKEGDGITETFKIQNNKKTPCKVYFSIEKRQSGTEECQFFVQREFAMINPHEHTYIKVKFKPTIMTQYAGIFLATVENGEQKPKNQKLQFDLRGEGILPTLRLQEPSEWIDDMHALMKFPRTRIGKVKTKQLVIKNAGTIPATVKFELSHHKDFKFND